MKTIHSLLAASALTGVASSSAIGKQVEVDAPYSANEAWKRASPQAPNGYAPKSVDCPSTRPSVRPASGLSNSETTWLQKRRKNTVEPMRDFLTRINIAGFDASAYINKHSSNVTALPNVALAFSGGGYRAMTNGAGVLAAFDSRTQGSTAAGHIGGLLQSATYVAGLSGGAWLVGSIYTNNFTSVQRVIDQGNDGVMWQLGNSILQGPKQDGIQVLNTVDYFSNLQSTVSAKEDAGFNASLTDWWGRALSFQLVNATDGGPAYTFSSISEDTDFSNGNAPMPIIVADERAPGEQLISATATNLEFNPYEMGSFDPSLYGFVPLKYIGSRFEAGQLPQNETCIAGFDNAGFVMGTSSSLFNQFILNFDGVSGVPSIVKDAIKGLLQGLSKDDNDIADYTPNPFFHYNNKTNPSAETRRLTLVDGGEDGQNIPLNPLIQPVRAVDVIFAVDSSADTILNHNASAATNWPNGTSLVATYERSLNATTQNGTAFPAIPDMNTFVNLGLNNRPTFFGCNASNMTGHSPLIVYLPNTPYVYQSNTSTYQLQYNNTERNAIIQNGYDMATMGNGTVDKDWPTCVACAVLSRSFDRTGEKVPDACSQCFTKYCWNGTLAPQEPAPYFPSLKMADKKISVKGGVGRFAPNVFGLALVAAVSVALLI